MEIEDIRQTILYEMNDIHDVENICYTDHLYNKLCTDKHFWIHFYKKNNINFPNNIYNNVDDYIKEYKHIINLMNETTKLIHNMVLGNKNTVYKFRFNKKKINMNVLALDQPDEDGELIDFLKRVDTIVSVHLSANNGVFSIEYIYHNNAVEFQVDRKTMFNYLFKILSADIILRKSN